MKAEFDVAIDDLMFKPKIAFEQADWKKTPETDAGWLDTTYWLVHTGIPRKERKIIAEEVLRLILPWSYGNKRWISKSDSRLIRILLLSGVRVVNSRKLFGFVDLLQSNKEKRLFTEMVHRQLGHRWPHIHVPVHIRLDNFLMDLAWRSGHLQAAKFSDRSVLHCLNNDSGRY